MLRKIVSILPKSFKNYLRNNYIIIKIFDYYSKRYYSQEGEDIFIRNFFPEDYRGFYLDIGAHHPFIYSNTALLYKLGWIGINIDAFPGSMKLFNKVRKRDLNLEIGISSQKSDLDFYIFEERELNTFDREIYKMQVSRGKVFECTKKIQCLTFNAIIEKYVTSNNSIDLITIDIEGHELNVIKTINFNLIHPQLFIIEFIESSIDKVLTSEINNILNVNDYYLVASLGNSQIFSKNGRKYLR